MPFNPRESNAFRRVGSCNTPKIDPCPNGTTTGNEEWQPGNFHHNSQYFTNQITYGGSNFTVLISIEVGVHLRQAACYFSFSMFFFINYVLILYAVTPEVLLSGNEYIGHETKYTFSLSLSTRGEYHLGNEFTIFFFALFNIVGLIMGLLILYPCSRKTKCVIL